jgi:hypothetical protein
LCHEHRSGQALEVGHNRFNFNAGSNEKKQVYPTKVWRRVNPTYVHATTVSGEHAGASASRAILFHDVQRSLLWPIQINSSFPSFRVNHYVERAYNILARMCVVREHMENKVSISVVQVTI